ncbi:MAG: hypothetical protein OGM80_12785 [Oscillospiraceae bacterium]|jgi:hypothetical protein|uniref:hypothetical protein n=1 Tax=Faecalibacterium prausnitzii TaxID=853 RepID=UPI000E4DCDF7|nr:hypothetical protein [Faecalibacterium prausnitzii]RHC41624.1 hypothetical protein DW844_08995 [Faecalibacterium prausnitzii]UYI70398.1 MAG: hypothetical protein OGM80_12785 [Oscillospiraceae bacterium]
MKAKRIVSILLTGSMLLSLLPVSALAAAPVFDAPAQTTAKKAAPLVQEADASRSTEEEAATRSSRDLDAENGTADSFSIQLNAEGYPADSGDGTHWLYVADSACWLYNGVFALQPSSEAEAESALQATLRIIKDAEFNSGIVGSGTDNYGTISGGTFQRMVYNYRAYDDQGSIPGVISGGTFQGDVVNWGTISDGTFLGEVNNDYSYNNNNVSIPGVISGGTFQGTVYNSSIISNGNFQGDVRNYRTISGGTFEKAVEVYASSGTEAKIEGGTFEKGMTLANNHTPIIIEDGQFDGEVVTKECNSPLSISGGLFTKAVNVSSIDDPTDLSITGGYFVSKPTVPEGSVSFTSVSDQNGRTFQVRVNGGFSKNGYEALYVPHGMSERQANPITVKTDTALIDCLADGESIMGTDKVRKNNDGSYAIDVYSPASIVLVTAEPTPPTLDDSEIDSAFSSGAAALGIVLGTAGLGYATYIYGSSLYLHYALPDGFIPSTRQELANVLWTTAGKPDPVSTALYTDIPADAIEQQKAARWCAEQGLLSDHGATFGPDTKVTNARIIRAWNSLKKVPVTITK